MFGERAAGPIRFSLELSSGGSRREAITSVSLQLAAAPPLPPASPSTDIRVRPLRATPETLHLTLLLWRKTNVS